MPESVIELITKTQETIEDDEIKSTDELERVIKDLNKEGIETKDRPLKAISESEKVLQQAYTGRYLFELIQNVRDANRKAGKNGAVFIRIEDNSLIVANTGSPFTKRGIESITTIGDSTKDSREFIGFKGIGFKSVQEITDTPRVIMRHGSMVFDRTLSWPDLRQRLKSIQQVPLFFIPHFSQERLTDEELAQGIVTRIVLPLRANANGDDIDGGFKDIQIRQMILLGNIKYLEFVYRSQKKYYDISEPNPTGKVTVESDIGPSYFKHFKPSKNIQIPADIIAGLGEKERELYEKDSMAEISIVFDVSENNRLQPITDANLYLYYPLKIQSGFQFLIHSCFIVNPERTDVMNNRLNQFLLERIADYLSGEWLTQAKRLHRNTFLDYLAFKRNKQAPILNHLYGRLLSKLRDEKFIWDNNTEAFYRPDQVMIGDWADRGLFEDNKLDGKQIIYVDNSDTSDWLTEELGIDYLYYETIKAHIEEECRRQLKKNNFDFFNHLYRYLVEHDNFSLKGCKILLSDRRKLFSNEDTVFYGMSKAGRPRLSNRLSSKIHFSHPSIKISEQRQGKDQIGFVEFNMELLVIRLLSLYNDDVPKEEILLALLSLDIKERLFPLIKSKIKFKLNSGRWVNPLEAPVYLPVVQLKSLYPENKFVDTSLLLELGLDEAVLLQRLGNFGAWSIPAISFIDKAKRINQGDPRFSIIYTFRWNSTPYFDLIGDWTIDMPAEPDNWFAKSIFDNWEIYAKMVVHDEAPVMKFKSQTSYPYDIEPSNRLSVTSIVQILRSASWLRVATSLLSPTEVVGLGLTDFHSTGSGLYKKHLDIFPIDYASNKSALDHLGIKHVDAPSIKNWENTLTFIFEKHRLLNSETKEFILFYNKILNKLYEYFEYALTEKTDIKRLANINFLSINEQTNELSWKKGKDIFYMDDKPSYDILPAAIKTFVQPQFVNRDKNRFGKIATYIGLSFKMLIKQELIDDTYLREASMSQFVPSLAACLALTEQYLDITLHREIEKIKQTKVFIKDQVIVKVTKQGVVLQELPVEHKVLTGRESNIFTIDAPYHNPAAFFARLLNDYLIDLLGRDLQRLSNLLTDFLGRNDRISFLNTYDVQPERVAEIEEQMADKRLTDKQLFWRDILVAKRVEDPLAVFNEQEIHFDIVSRLLQVSSSSIILLDSEINTKQLNEPENIQPLTSLFKLLNLSLVVFNTAAMQKINFKDFYLRRFEVVKSRYKKRFEVVLYNHLLPLGLDRQVEFQDTADNYMSVIRAELPDYVLSLDIEKYFQQRLNEVYPWIKLSRVKGDTNLVGLFNSNLAIVKANLNEKAVSMARFDEFISFNRNRSPIYFGQTAGVIAAYTSWVTEYDTHPSEEDQLAETLNNFVNVPGATIETATTAALTFSNDGEEDSDNDKSGSGRRSDGGEPSPQKQLIGLVSEKVVYELLLAIYSDVEWVSKNAARAKVNPEGHDRYGYDISYVDKEDNIHYVEVKGKSNAQQHFYITYPEVRKAHKEKAFYHVIFVSNALNNETRKVRDLGNIFILGELEDIFNNNRFSAKFNVLEISFD